MKENTICVCVKNSYNPTATEEAKMKATCESWKVSKNRIPDLKYIAGYISIGGYLKMVTCYEINECVEDGDRIKFIHKSINVDDSTFVKVYKSIPARKKIRNPIFYTNAT